MHFNFVIPDSSQRRHMFDLTLVFFFLPLGSTFICNTHIIPVKNQEGVAMMFIINFEYVTDEDSAASPERVNPILPVKSVNRKYKATYP